MTLVYSVTSYTYALLNEFRDKILSLVNYDIKINTKKLKQLSLPKDGFEFITRKELTALMHNFSLNCSASYDQNIIKIHRIEKGYERVRAKILSATYSNIINLKKIENYPQLKQLYITSFLLKYNSTIPLKTRPHHIFDELKYQEFCKGLELGFIKGISTHKESNSTFRTFDWMDMKDDASTLCWLFGRYCTIKSLFNNIDENDTFELIRVLHGDISMAEEFKRNLNYDKKDPAEVALKKFASTGGRAKAENYQTKMNPIFDEVFSLFQNEPYRVCRRVFYLS